MNERRRFTPEQIAGIMFTKLKQITDTELKTKAIDCVIGVRFFDLENLNSYEFSLRYLVFLLMLKDELCLTLPQ